MAGARLGDRDSRPCIADYALLGDCHGAALVSRDGSIDWWCAPRFDSRSSFARLLDPEGGHWSIRPVAPFETEREYLADTMVVQTTFRTSEGTLRVTDALSLAPGAREHDVGHASPHTLVRLVEGVSGRVEVAVELAPRLEYGLVVPELIEEEGGLRSYGGPDTLTLTGDRRLETDGGVASARLELRAGESAAFGLSLQEGISSDAPRGEPPRHLLEETVAGWRSWAALHTAYEGVYREPVRRSALLLQALTYQPTGAVVAAPTTSLPEIVGGSANWDYRYAWLRDASLTLGALWVAACPDEADRYFDWMARAAAGARNSGQLQIMFGVEGERDLTEHELDHLAGYRSSTPVRVGNDAWRQKQLDVYGEVLDAAYLLRERIEEFDPLTTAFLCTLADQAAERWMETDAGIWEGRQGERHYVSSKLMCWVALDRAVRLAPRLGAGAAPERWGAARDAVRAEILERGWSDDAGAYTGAFGSDHLDASVLLMPLMDFLPASDGRMRLTIGAIERELGEGGLVRRWTGGEEGGFVICSYWLADCLARAGEPDRAREIFDAISAHANDVGLLSEEVDPCGGELIGNFPQAFSHVGLINAAWSIDRAEAGKPGDERGD